MSVIFNQINERAVEHSPATLYIREDAPYHTNGLTVVYDLILLNRVGEEGDTVYGAVYVEFAYSVTNKKDNFDRKVGRAIALDNLYDAGHSRSNYGSFFLGVGYDMEAVEHMKSEGHKFKMGKGDIPLRLINAPNPYPWVLQKDFNLTGVVHDKVLMHFIQNEQYEY